MARYINEQGEPYNGRYVIQDGVKYLSPSEEKLLALGYRKVEDEVATYEPTTEERTRPFKEQLASEDYKVIKCMEAYLRGLPLPYDIDVLGAARDAVRGQINEIEEEEDATKH